ncbi:HNH endonuclease [Microcoleus sp. ZQ-A2]|nr:HNH endonuclease [Microcoleus sp. FACHB-1]
MVNRAGKPYPCVIDPRTNNPIPFPTGDIVKVPKSDRVPWGRKERGEYIAEWYRRGYDTPPGGWSLYDIHHIKPREYGGTNDFENLVPVLRQVHIDEFNAFWRDW